MSHDPPSTTPTPYPDLNAVLAELLAGVRDVLGERFVGAYLHGSFAHGDFDEASDVDFLVVTTDELPAAQIASLNALHARIYEFATRWAQHLEGSYIPRAVLWRHVPPAVQMPYLDNGSRELIMSDHHDSRVDRWVLREHGIVLAGPAPREVVARVSGDDLRDHVRQTMRQWADSLALRPAYLRTRWGQPFVVLSYCRMLQTLASGRVESKRAAARWAQQALPQRWHGLIERAWNERPEPDVKIRQAADEGDVELTLAFVRYALEAS